MDLHPVGLKLAPRVRLFPSRAAVPVHEAGLVVLVLAPGPVFGDGTHATTRLCARGVDLCCRTRPPAAVLDVGTGTGVLALLAAAHGAARVVGTDADPVALEAARANAGLNHMAQRVEFSSAPPDHWGPTFDLVVANIIHPVLLALAGALMRATAPGGTLLLSGFTPAEAPMIRAAMAGHGMTVRAQCALEEWALLDVLAPE